MKNILCVLIAAAMLFGIAGCDRFSVVPPGDQVLDDTLNLFTWAGYVPDSIIKKFTDETGIKINYTSFSSNEEMLDKLTSNMGSQYDIIICSDYIIEKMRTMGPIIAELDPSKIANYKNINPVFQYKSYDSENKYSIPYAASSHVIVYNPSKVNFEITGYADLWDQSLAGALVLLDDARSVVGMTLRKMGYSINLTDKPVLERAKDELFKLRYNVALIDASAPQDALLSGKASVGYLNTAQAAAAVAADPNLKVVYPKEGMSIGIDSIIMPANAPHKSAAYEFIDFILDAKNSAQISYAINHHSTNSAAVDYLPPEYLENKAVFVPDEYLKLAENLMDVGDAAVIYDRIWAEFKKI